VTGGPAAPLVATIGNSPITFAPGASSVVLGPGTTLFPGSPGIILPGGTPVSIAAPTGPNGAPIIIYGKGSNANSITIPPAGSSQSTPTPLVLPANGNNAPITIAPGASSVVLGPGTILQPGSPPVTLSNGQVVSLSPPSSSGGSPVLVYGTGAAASSVTLPPAAGTPAGFVPFAITGMPGGSTASIAPNSAIVVGGTTLTPGSAAATISGTAVSLASGSAYIVVGSSTFAISASPTGTDSSGFGSLIWKGLGGSATSTSSSESVSVKWKTKTVTTTEMTTIRMTETVAAQAAATTGGVGKMVVPDRRVVVMGGIFVAVALAV